jgi:hypothetical protein
MQRRPRFQLIGCGRRCSPEAVTLNASRAIGVYSVRARVRRRVPLRSEPRRVAIPVDRSRRLSRMCWHERRSLPERAGSALEPLLLRWTRPPRIESPAAGMSRAPPALVPVGGPAPPPPTPALPVIPPPQQRRRDAGGDGRERSGQLGSHQRACCRRLSTCTCVSYRPSAGAPRRSRNSNHSRGVPRSQLTSAATP